MQRWAAQDDPALCELQVDVAGMMPMRAWLSSSGVQHARICAPGMHAAQWQAAAPTDRQPQGPWQQPAALGPWPLHAQQQHTQQQ